MLTDAAPRKANRTQFLESDRIKSLDLPLDKHLQEMTTRIEAAMKTDKIRDVRSACTEFLATASKFYEVPQCGVRVLAARPLRTREYGTFELFGDYTPESIADSHVDADGGSEGSHVVRYVPQHPLPRILPSSRFQEVRLC